MIEVKNIIKQCAMVLDLPDVVETLDSNSSTDLKDNKVIKQLLYCLNLALSEFATDYFNLLTKEEICVTTGRCPLSSLTKKAYKIKEIYNANKKTSIKIVDESLVLDNGIYEIIYSYQPEVVDLDDRLSNFSGRVNERLYVVSTIKEYATIKNFSELYQIYEQKFNDCIKARLSPLKNIQLKKRRWR